jgi:anti-sigma regulatory factor (Ser/Thr protein kinase)
MAIHVHDRLAVDVVPNAPPRDHAVDVYADEFAIIRELIRFVEDGLALGETVVVVANRPHRSSLAAWCTDHLSVGDTESLLLIDAAETLQKFLVAGSPDPVLFEATIGAIVDRATRNGRTLRVFGEMVALLWADGNFAGALALESLWNDMASNRRFFLLCASPATSLDEASIRAVNAMCDRHSDLSLLGHQMKFANATTATPSHTQRLLPPISTAVSVARQIAIRTLVDWELLHLIENSVIITSELAANAVLHAESSFRLMLSRDATWLRIAIEDAVPCRLAVVRGSDEFIGRGLGFVEAIASDWGCEVTPDGKTVWAELPV